MPRIPRGQQQNKPGNWDWGWGQRYFRPYNNYYSQDLFQSQYSNVSQMIYNQGFMDGVNQTANVNQTQHGGWWY